MCRCKHSDAKSKWVSVSHKYMLRIHLFLNDFSAISYIFCDRDSFISNFIIGAFRDSITLKVSAWNSVFPMVIPPFETCSCVIEKQKNLSHP